MGLDAVGHGPIGQKDELGSGSETRAEEGERTGAEGKNSKNEIAANCVNRREEKETLSSLIQLFLAVRDAHAPA